MKTSFFARVIGPVLAGCLVLAGMMTAQAQPGGEGMEMFNPDWSMYINAYGYSDFAFDQRPGFEGREYLSGEWAAAVEYQAGATHVAPDWINPDFIFPDWTSDSDFSMVTDVHQLAGTNGYGFAILQSIINNPQVRITITSEFVDTTNGIPQGMSPRSASKGSNQISDRYLMHQTFSISNISGTTLTSFKFFKFLHALEAESALYDDRNYGPAYHGDHFTITEFTHPQTPLAGDVFNQDTVCLHAGVAPVAWEVGYYGIDGIDNHSDGKPGTGVHLSVEADSLSGLDSFNPPQLWVSGALKFDLGSLAPGQSTNIEFLMSLQTVTTASAPFAVGKALKVFAWGDNSHGQTNIPPAATNVTAVAAGGNHSLALLATGGVVAWGDNSHGQATVPPGLGVIEAVACGSNHNVVLDSGGLVTAWGDNTYGQTNLPGLLAHSYAVAAGANFNLALLPDDTIVGWGDNSHGQTNIPAYVNSTGVYTMAAGANHALAILYDGSVVGWGDDEFGQDDVPDAVQYYAYNLAAGANHSLALLEDGSVAAWGDNSHGQCTVPASIGYNAQSIAAGGNVSMAILYDGSIVVWGDNSHGQTNVPAGIGQVTSMAAGQNHVLAVGSAFVPPQLSVNHSGGNIVVSFPAPYSLGGPSTPAVLEETSTLHGNNWQQNSAAAVLNGGVYNVSIPFTNGNHFYRLNASGSP